MKRAPGPASLADQVVEAWRINHRVNLTLLEHTSDAGLTATLSTRGGRDVGRQFAHLHDLRVWMLDAYAKDLARSLKAFAKKDAPKVTPTKAALVTHLNQSAEAVATWLSRGAAEPEQWKSSKRGVVVTLGYLISHESHHRGSILLTLKQSGQKLPQDVSYGIWNWNKV